MRLVVSEPPKGGPPALAPEITPRMVSSIIRRGLSSWEPEPGLPEGVIAAESAPNKPERELLEARKAEILKALAPVSAVSGDVLEMVLAVLLGGFKAAIRAEDAGINLTIYKRAVRDLPLWAIQAASDKFLTGSVQALGIEWNPAFPPTTAQVVEVAKRVRPIAWVGGERSARATFVELETERNQINKVLAAKVVGAGVTDEDRAKVAALVADVKAALLRRVDLSGDPEPEAVELHRAGMVEANQLLKARERAHRAQVEALEAELKAADTAQSIDKIEGAGS